MNTEKFKPQMSVSVRNLVDFTLRTGDLDLTVFGSTGSLEAIRVHRDIQNTRPSCYHREVPVHFKFETERFILDIRGRMDGVYRYPDGVLIEEIKTTKKALTEMVRNENRVHWGQLKCYAYILTQLEDLTTIEAQLVYFHLDSRRIKEIRKSFDRRSLKQYFDDLIARYLEWIGELYEWIQFRNQSIKNLTFPFAQQRPGQDLIMEKVRGALEKEQQLFVQAPTGLGKTMSVIYPSILAIATGRIRKIFFLTARTTGRNAAEESLARLRENGLRLKSISLTAKEKVCFNPDTLCNGKECRYARGFYDRINSALLNAFQQDDFRQEIIESLALEHRVCPFEFSLELSMWVDLLICDYNYAFDPRVYIRRLFQDGMNDYAFLIDEAHNLVDRSREMFSSHLHEDTIRELMDILRGKLPGVYKSLDSLKSWMDRFKEGQMQDRHELAEKELPLDFCSNLERFTSISEKWLTLNQYTDFRQSLMTFYFKVQGFRQIAERFDESYATCYTLVGNALQVKLFCMDPSGHLEAPLQRSKTSIFFSATLSPMHYFITSLGCNEEAQSMILPPPFDENNLCTMIAWKISTLYKHRDMTKGDVAEVIFETTNQKQGNYLVYFPSYAYMKMVYDLFVEMNPGCHTIVQTPNMSEFERQSFIEQFHEQNGHRIVGFAVLGGVFAESIDLLGERLTGAVIVGVGLPGISLERDLIKAYYNHLNGFGFAFAYQIPGMVKVLQASGRVIRSEHDRGTVLLIGARFAKPPYRNWLPETWHLKGIQDSEEIGETLRRFWEGKSIGA